MLYPRDAEQRILDLVHPLDAVQDAECVDLEQAHGRILAQAVVSHLDFPHWDNSAMDGYAVRFEDVKDASGDRPTLLTLVEEIPAGYQPTVPIQEGQAARIFTGAILPEGADTIVIQENTERQGDRVSVLVAPEAQAFVRHKGAFYQAGKPLLQSGIRLSAPELAILAAAQCTSVAVYRRPRVAIFSTGNELVSPDQPLQTGQIVDSNQYALAALVEATGAVPIPLGIVPDQPDRLQSRIAEALANADVIISSGGVSVGDYDFVDRILEELGAQIHVRSVAVKPGKPLTVAVFNPKSADSDSPKRPILYFGLPGNPVSALVSYWRFVQPAIRKLSGVAAGWLPTFIEGRSPVDLSAGGQRETYIWGRVHILDGKFIFEPAGGGHSSGNLINLATTNALAVVPIGASQIPAETPVQIMVVGKTMESL